MKETMTPQPKVVAGSVAGAASIVLVWVMGEAGIQMPAEVASSITVLLSSLAAYMKRA